MMALTPNSREAYATDWPWLPVEAAITRRCRSSSLNRLTRLIPPRTLNAAVGLWFACFTYSSDPTRRSSGGYRRRGVGCRYGRICLAASSTSANAGSSNSLTADRLGISAKPDRNSVPSLNISAVPRAFAKALLVASVLLVAAGCGYDTSATFNPDGSVTVGMKFLFPKSLMQGGSGTTVSGFSPSDIASANAKLQAQYPGGKVSVVTEGDESGALVTIPFKTEKDAFAFMTQPSKLSPAASSSSSGLSLNLSNTGGMFTSATHSTSGQSDTYTFKTAPAVQPSPSPGSQEVLTGDELASMFTVTFALTAPRVITSAQ